MKRTVLILLSIVAVAASVLPAGAAPNGASDSVRVVAARRSSGGTDLDFRGTLEPAGNLAAASQPASASPTAPQAIPKPSVRVAKTTRSAPRSGGTLPATGVGSSGLALAFLAAAALSATTLKPIRINRRE